MSIIHQLSPHVADLIAAGEVVERPGSVVKELVENAIDAGAQHITTEIQNGGMTLIRVTDDGCGMDRTDAQTAFLRHATSKLRKPEDLAAIGTLGFRGEALAAISAVSKVQLLTCPQDGTGTSLQLEAGVIVSCDDAGCPKGTTMLVRDLFYNTPARLKFMKTDMAEGANVAAVMQRLAVAHPEIAFRLLRDGQEVLNTAGDGKLLSVIYVLFGRQTAGEMVPVDSSWERVKLTGYVTRPMTTRGNRNGQMFYVNGRFVRSKTLTAAFEEAYRNQMMTGRYPGCVLNLEIPLNMVDVNVHPAKTEVRFLSEKSIFDCVYYGTLAALKRASGQKELELEKKNVETERQASGTANGSFRRMTAEEYRNLGAMQNALSGKPVQTAGKTPDIVPNPAETAPIRLTAVPEKHETKGLSLEEPVRLPEKQEQTAKPAAGRPVSIFPSKEETALMMGVQSKVDDAAEKPAVPEAAPVRTEEAAQIPNGGESAATVPVQEMLPLEDVPQYRVVGEVMNCYIVVEEPGAMLLIDKHAAHERILFEKLKKQDHSAMSQMLLTPLTAQLSREEAVTILENVSLLKDCGFDIEDFGDHTVLVRAIPDDLNESDAQALLAQMASDLQAGKNTSAESRRDALLHTMACKAAIKGGWRTGPEEREALVHAVMTRDDLKYCPHGRPICIRITESNIRRQFNRS